MSSTVALMKVFCSSSSCAAFSSSAYGLLHLNILILTYCEKLDKEAVQRNLKRLKIKLKGQAHEI
jgi:hypothetical protein